MPTSELTDTSLNIAGTTTIKGIESTLTNNASLAATSSAILTAINNSASNVSSYVDSQISNIKYVGLLTESANNFRNTPSKNGLYLILDNQLNCPSNYGNLVSLATSNYTYQLFTRYSGDQWMRTSNESQWYDWKSLNGYVSGTISSDFSMASPFILYRVGNIVTFFVYLNVNTTISNNTDLAWFSVGFRPPVSVQVPGMFLGGSEDGCNIFFILDSGGTLRQNYGLSIAAQKIAVCGSFAVV